MTTSQLTHQKVIDFLDHNPMAVLSTEVNQQPHGAAIYFIVDEDFNFYFITRTKTQKYKDVLSDNRAALTIVNEGDLKTVQTVGKIDEVRDAETIDFVFNKFPKLHSVSKIAWPPPVVKIQKGEYVVMKFTPSKLRFADFEKFGAHGGGQEYFEDII